MRFKTTIQLVSDAQDKSEALDLVEEYLAGNIVSGVDMRCVTKPLCSKTKIAGMAVVVLALAVGIFAGANIKNSQNILQASPGTSAIQSPLKTAEVDRKSAEFRKEWQTRQYKEALASIGR